MTLEDFKDFDIFIDFGNGDKFYIKDFNIDEKNKKIVLKGSQGDMKWIKIDALYPIKSFKK
jgi:hypothetical protein